MRILNAIHSQSIGGVEQVFRDYTQALTMRGHEVALLISKNGNENYSATKIFKLKNFAQIFDFLKLLLIVISYRPKVIICHSRRLMKWMRLLKFFLPQKIFNYHTIAVNHGITFDTSLHCDFIISINRQIKDLVDKHFDQKKSFVVNNAIDISQKYQQKKFNNICPTIGIYGRIEPRKGFDVMLLAGKILQEKNQDFRFKIGGFEVNENYNLTTLKNLALQQQIIDKCNFVGVVKDKLDFFLDVDILCVPSREEPFGLVIIEGFLYSTLVIASDTDGAKLLITDQQNGLLFKNESSQDLVDKILSIINNPQNYNQICQQAYKVLQDRYSLESLSQNLQNILTKINND